MTRQVIRTVEELDGLPVGSVILVTWLSWITGNVMQKYSDGWYGFPSDTAMYPLGAGVGNSVVVLWVPDGTDRG